MTVAVVDTGVNGSLPGLRDVVVSGTNARRNGTGDGRTDTDKYGHGTQMAELIAGQGQDDGMVGVAPGAKILPITADDSPYTQAKAIRYAVDHGARVINISLASDDDPGPTCTVYASVLQEAVAYAAEKNVVVVVVAGAGNQGNTLNAPMSPANCAGVLAVGAVDANKVAWTHSEHQPYVAVAAPGLGTGSVGKDGRYISTNGTSNSSALTSGVVALIRAQYPNLSAREVVQKIINTAVDAGPPGHDEYTGNGVVIPILALTKDVDKAAPNPPYERLDQWLASRGKSSGAAPSGRPTAAKKKESSGSGTLVAVLAAGAVVVIAVVAILLVLRRRGRSGPVVEQRPFTSGPYPGHSPAPGSQGPYGGPQYGGDQSSGRPQGPSPTFLPPTGQDDRSN